MRSFPYVYSISIENLFSISFSMSFTDINHFSISLSFSYWNITGLDIHTKRNLKQTLARIRALTSPVTADTQSVNTKQWTSVVKFTHQHTELNATTALANNDNNRLSRSRTLNVGQGVARESHRSLNSMAATRRHTCTLLSVARSDRAQWVTILDTLLAGSNHS